MTGEELAAIKERRGVRSKHYPAESVVDNGDTILALVARIEHLEANLDELRQAWEAHGRGVISPSLIRAIEKVVAR